MWVPPSGLLQDSKDETQKLLIETGLWLNAKVLLFFSFFGTIEKNKPMTEVSISEQLKSAAPNLALGIVSASVSVSQHDDYYGGKLTNELRRLHQK